MMFTLSAGINCFIILKLYFFCITRISFDKCEQPEWFHWVHWRWPFYTCLRHVHVLDHGHFTDIVSALAI
jgi:hypothetical protein